MLLVYVMSALLTASTLAVNTRVCTATLATAAAATRGQRSAPEESYGRYN